MQMLDSSEIISVDQPPRVLAFLQFLQCSLLKLLIKQFVLFDPLLPDDLVLCRPHQEFSEGYILLVGI